MENCPAYAEARFSNLASVLDAIPHYNIKFECTMTKIFSFFPSVAATMLVGMLSLALSHKVLADDREERNFDVQDFTEIYLKGPYAVTLSQGNSCSLRIEAPANAFDDIEVDVHGGLLSINWEGSKIKSSRNISIRIGFADLNKIRILGAVDMQCEDLLRLNNLKIEFEGAGNLELDLRAEKIISEIAGVGNFNLTGTTEYHKVEFSGVGKYDARDLISQYTYVESTGVGTVKVHASTKFIGEASGVGSVDYYGNPGEVTINATGIGSIDRH
jgi:hypothetical protein